MDARMKKSFDSVVENTKNAIRKLFKKNIVVFNTDFYTDLRTVLAFRPVGIYDIWRLADNLKDEDFLACELAIKTRNFDGLTSLRDSNNQKGYICLPYGMFADYLNMFIRLRYLFVIYAHLAKKLHARSAALKFLSSASILANCIIKSVPYLTDSSIEEII